MARESVWRGMTVVKMVPALLVLVVAACRDGGVVSNDSTSSDGGGSDDAPTSTTNASATDTTTGDTTTGETTAGDTTAGDTTAVDTTAGDTTAGDTTAADTTAGDTTAGDTTGGEVDEPYGGVWCGNASTGALEMGSTRGVIDFHGAAASPVPIVGWADDADQVMVARYDVASASWLEPDVVATDFPSDGLQFGHLPVGAVLANGDAWIGYGVSTPEPHVVIHRFEMATETWSREDLPDILVDPYTVGMVATSTGHAALFANDLQPGGYDSRVAVWFFDPDTAAWTAEPLAELESWYIGESTESASDPTSGNIVLAKDGELGTLTLWRYVTATDEIVRDEIATDGDNVEKVIALGEDAFVVVTRRSEFQGPYVLSAHHFDGSAWQPAVEIGSGVGLGAFRGSQVVGDVGRVGIVWTESQGAAFATTYATDTGWLEPSMLQANEPMAAGAISSGRVALEETGMFVVWAALAAGSVTPRSSWFDGQSWSETLTLDPNQPTTYSDMRHLHSLGPGRARAVWERHDRLGSPSWLWACHTPSHGWSAPVVTSTVRRAVPRANGEVLVVTIEAGPVGFAEYFGAAD